ncbi:TetR/AcrR family transcriptional regulator [Streptomyces sp. H27-D2]|uniref:TetR/AcrR family transcriptional regulator n=1 Tax=Streptomyces sp. H27-D2 TaxID=3046304 RepID=UPI002DB74725|nr:TetR family transcriptional regulator [Streptomyces sp. H27-D2]MEC4017160.1 TetR family transcriptional regulator [Streptomyces sp. H27-D2]
MTFMAPVQTTPSASPKPGLRERKKTQTRQAIRRAAYRLFAEQGYDATPVDRIAEAADVSSSTVFRYFPTKEDIVITDEYDQLMEEAFRARPAEEPPLEALWNAIMDTLRQFYASEREEIDTRIRLTREVPAIRARMNESMTETGRMVIGVLSERTGRPTDDLELRVFVGAVLGALQEVMLHWGEQELTDDLVGVVDRTLALLARGLTL